MNRKSADRRHVEQRIAQSIQVTADAQAQTLHRSTRQCPASLVLLNKCNDHPTRQNPQPATRNQSRHNPKPHFSHVPPPPSAMASEKTELFIERPKTKKLRPTKHLQNGTLKRL
ncbi:unnamed protein product [Hymenolepis diminuta]|uniref:Uncharacterized protein n=1 Tax=Hymenolepis diminuta TaxID=6216 RepID=A0A0R3S8P9_HYMDI|nr:unnamed protein product [Hymenolepis diminuta]